MDRASRGGSGNGADSIADEGAGAPGRESRRSTEGDRVGCPDCGGAVRVQIAPSYFRCVGDRFEPYLDHNGHTVGGYVRCGRQYHDGGSATDEVCRCGTFAIRRCVRCSVQLCGDHSLLTEKTEAGQWVCRPCLKVIRAEEWAEQIAAYRALPAVSEQRMFEHILGVGDYIKDGVTHHLWDWTNRDIAQVTLRAYEALPPTPHGRSPRESLLRCLLGEEEGFDADGTRIRWKARIIDLGHEMQGSVSDGYEEVGHPEYRFNDLVLSTDRRSPELVPGHGRGLMLYPDQLVALRGNFERHAARRVQNTVAPSPPSPTLLHPLLLIAVVFVIAAVVLKMLL